jgi:acylphosphatase
MGAVARRVVVEGRVQGVAFRYRTLERAEALGVHGWVRNLTDGRVEAWLEGDAGAVDALLTWLREGPPMSRVAGVDVRTRAAEGLEGFEVRPTVHGT